MKVEQTNYIYCIDHLRWQLIADHNEWRFLFELVGMNTIINSLFALPILFYLNVLKTEKILQFWDKKF